MTIDALLPSVLRSVALGVHHTLDAHGAFNVRVDLEPVSAHRIFLLQRKVSELVQGHGLESAFGQVDRRQADPCWIANEHVVLGPGRIPYRCCQGHHVEWCLWWHWWYLCLLLWISGV